MSRKVYGFIRAILSRDPSHTAPPFVVEIYSPTVKPGERTKRFNLKEVCDNRELVLVSILRDAMIHSLPVELSCDDEGFINSIEMRTTTFYEEWKIETVTGKVKMISVDEFGLGKGNQDNPDLATVFISSKPNMKLYLNLQRPIKETKLAQLSLLKHAYKNNSFITIKYQNQPIAAGKVAKIIYGVQLGETNEISP